VQYIHAKVTKVLDSSDRKTRVNVLARNDGLFEFRAYVERYEEGPFAGEPYWSPTVHSGLYETIEDAERDALNVVLASAAKPTLGH